MEELCTTTHVSKFQVPYTRTASRCSLFINSIASRRLQVLKKRTLIISIISLLVTLTSPYLFKGYFEKKPYSLTQSVHFGGPIPFVNQEVILPGKESLYPLEVDFQSPFEEKTHINLISFFFSFLIFFSIFFSLYHLLIYFFRKNDRYEK